MARRMMDGATDDGATDDGAMDDGWRDVSDGIDGRT